MTEPVSVRPAVNSTSPILKEAGEGGTISPATTQRVKRSRRGLLVAGVVAVVIAFDATGTYEYKNAQEAKTRKAAETAATKQAAEDTRRAADKAAADKATAQQAAAARKAAADRAALQSESRKQPQPPPSGTNMPPATVSGIWRSAGYTFTLTQNGDAVISEGSFGHAEGHFTGPNTFTLTWASGTFTGNVRGDTIYWSNNTSWARQRVNVSGIWRNAGYTFTLTQNGDAVISEGSFGHAEGHFTGPNTFTLTWASGTFTGNVRGDTIYWSNNTSWARQAAGQR